MSFWLASLNIIKAGGVGKRGAKHLSKISSSPPFKERRIKWVPRKIEDFIETGNRTSFCYRR